MFYVDNPGYGGPKWDDVKIRQTFDALTGYMIEYKVCSSRGQSIYEEITHGSYTYKNHL